eukprot:COSAG01_NODE_3731_length_5755_cov_6.626414_4_plen_68_part_00
MRMDGPCAAQVRRCSQLGGTHSGGFTINQVARYGGRNGTVGPCTLVGASGLPAIPTNVTKLLLRQAD